MTLGRWVWVPAVGLELLVGRAELLVGLLETLPDWLLAVGRVAETLPLPEVVVRRLPERLPALLLPLFTIRLLLIEPAVPFWSRLTEAT